MRTRLLRSAVAVAAAAALCTTGPAVAGPVSVSTVDAKTDTGDWGMWQRLATGTRYNPAERKITPATVGNLKLKWAYTYPVVPFTAMGSQPAIVNGTLYVGAPDAKFLALDAKTGASKWSFDLAPVTGTLTHTNPVRDGASVVNGIVYFGDSTGRVYALNARTGALVWSTPVDDHPEARMTGSPLVYNGRVYIGVSTSEGGTARNPSYPCCSHRGQVVALNAANGTVDWRYYTVPQPQQVGTWPSGAAKFSPSGGSVWAVPVVDPGTRTIFVGTGNNATGFEGDTDSMLALDATNGSLRWRQQVTHPDTITAACTLVTAPNEYCPGKGTYALDTDIGATANVFTVRGRTIVGVGQKGGMFHAFDARTGAIVWQTQLDTPDPGSNDPGGGGVEWGSAYDGKYIYAATQRGKPGTLFALDPSDGHIVWQTPYPSDGCTTGGAAAYPTQCELAFTPAVSATPGLLYEGGADGKMRIFSSATGQLLWSFDAIQDFQGVNGPVGHGTGISGTGGAVISDGILYVQAGYYPFYPTDKGSVLLAFGL
jgi:polyvinyl alcohol dehydrogenase (cytochrome)